MSQSTPRAKFPKRTLAMFGNVSRICQFQKFFQHTHVVHLCPTLKQVHTLSYSTIVDQVESQLQSQHCPTSLQARLVESPTVEPILLSPVGVFLFLFGPPNGQATVEHVKASPSISRTSHVR